MYVITPNFVLTGAEADLPAGTPRILWENRATFGTVTSSSSAAGFPASNMANVATNQEWRAAAPGAVEWTWTPSTADDIDAVGIARHNFGSAGIGVEVGYNSLVPPPPAGPSYFVRASFDAANQSFTQSQILATQAVGVQDGRLRVSTDLTSAGGTLAISGNALVLNDPSASGSDKINIHGDGYNGPSGHAGPLPLDQALGWHYLATLSSSMDTTMGFWFNAYDGVGSQETFGAASFGGVLYLKWKGPGGIILQNTGVAVGAAADFELLVVNGGFDRAGVPWDGVSSFDVSCIGGWLFYYTGGEWELVGNSQYDPAQVGAGPPTPTDISPYWSPAMQSKSNNPVSLKQMAVENRDLKAALVPVFRDASVALNDTYTGVADQWLRYKVTTRPTAPGAGLDVMFRRVDDSNCWIARVDDAGTIYLIEKITGGENTRGSVGGAIVNGQQIMIDMNAARIRVFKDNGSLLIDYTSATNFQTATGAKISSLGTGGAIGHIIANKRRGYGSALPGNFASITFPTPTNPSSGSATRQLSLDGDSEIDGNQLHRAGVANYLSAMLGGDWTVSDFAVGGSTISSLVGRVATVNATYNAGNAQNELIVWAGTNDGFAGTSAASAASSMQSYLTTMIATWGAGHITFIAMLDRQQGGGSWSPSMASFRSSYNTAMQSFCATNGVRYLDPTAHGQITNSADTTYFVGDLVHVNYYSSGIVARQLFDLITAPAASVEFTSLVGPQIPASDEPMLFHFTPQPLSSLTIKLAAGLEAARAAVLYIGKMLIMERGVEASVDVARPRFARRTEFYNGRSERGDFLGRIVTSQYLDGIEHSYAWLTPDWYRAKMDRFILAAQQDTPFFYCFDPNTYPYEVSFCWLTDDPVPMTNPPTRRKKVVLKMAGITE